MLPKRAQELEKERERLYERFREEFKERWEELLKEVDFENEPYKKNFRDTQSFLLRLRRAISWLKGAQQMEEDVKKDDKNLSTQFMFLWVSFNALYARDPQETLIGKFRREETEFRKYFRNLLEFGEDAKTRIYNAVDSNILSEVMSLTKYRFVRPEFWKRHHDIHKIKKHLPLKKELLTPETLKKREVKIILYRVFECLYILRNQIMHGGSTWDSNLNKEQVKISIEIMSWLLPVFIEIMLKTPEDKWKLWGRVWYPRVEGVDIEGGPN